jgi:hypothetical protein
MGISLVPQAMEQIGFPFVTFVPFAERLPPIPVGVSHRRSSLSISLDILLRAARQVGSRVVPRNANSRLSVMR